MLRIRVYLCIRREREKLIIFSRENTCTPVVLPNKYLYLYRAKKRYDLEERTLEFAKEVIAFVKTRSKTIASIREKAK